MLPTCESCAVSKAKQKAICKESNGGHKATKPRERVYSDLLVIRVSKGSNTTIQNKNWHLIVNELSKYATSWFYETKDAIVEPTCELFNKWKLEGRPVQKLRQENAGENRALEKCMNSADWKLGIEIKYTGKGIPQQNYLVEIRFTTIAKLARAMMTDTHLMADMQENSVGKLSTVLHN